MNEDSKKIQKEAVDVFLRQSASPDDPVAQRIRDEFIARGPEERAAYMEVAKTWSASGVLGAGKKIRTIVAALVIFGLGYASYDPIRIVWMADIKAEKDPKTAILASGDLLSIDAGSAIVDNTDGVQRDVALLVGSAYFDVAPSDKPFSVQAGPLDVTVVGTAFETALTEQGATISVVEGTVRVSDERQDWILNAGDLLEWHETEGISRSQIPKQDVATWRDNRLVLDGLTLREALAILERRLPGRVLISQSALGEKTLSGRLDLSQPQVALELLAETSDGRLRGMTSLVQVIVPR